MSTVEQIVREIVEDANGIKIENELSEQQVRFYSEVYNEELEARVAGSPLCKILGKYRQELI